MAQRPVIALQAVRVLQGLLRLTRCLFALVVGTPGWAAALYPCAQRGWLPPQSHFCPLTAAEHLREAPERGSLQRREALETQQQADINSIKWPG